MHRVRDWPGSFDGILKNHIEEVLEVTNGKINGPDGAAAVLGVHPNTVRHRVKKLGIRYGRTFEKSLTRKRG